MLDCGRTSLNATCGNHETDIYLMVYFATSEDYEAKERGEYIASREPC